MHRALRRLSGAAYAAATIGSEDIVNGSIRNRDFKDGTLRGNEAKRDGFGGGAIKERSLNPAELDESRLGKVNSAASADGLTRHAVISAAGAVVRGRGTLGDPAAGAPPAGEIAVGSVAGNANGVLVVTRDSAGTATVDRSFHLTVSC